MSLLEPKTVDMFYFTGNKQTTPSCPVDMRPNFNPSSGVQSYSRSTKTCSRKSYYRIPFFLDRPGPKYMEWGVNSHEARPGHHTQVIRLTMPPTSDIMHLSIYNINIPPPPNFNCHCHCHCHCRGVLTRFSSWRVGSARLASFRFIYVLSRLQTSSLSGEHYNEGDQLIILNFLSFPGARHGRTLP